MHAHDHQLKAGFHKVIELHSYVFIQILYLWKEDRTVSLDPHDGAELMYIPAIDSFCDSFIIIYMYICIISGSSGILILLPIFVDDSSSEIDTWDLKVI